MQASDHELQPAHMVSVWMLMLIASAYTSSSLQAGEELINNIPTGLAADMQALLAIKKELITESSPILSDWVANSSSPCAWSRITCSPSRWLANQTRVTSLNLSALGLRDPSWPSGFSKLLALSHLNLSSNSFAGPLPQDSIANCSHLLSLDLSLNNLSALNSPSALPHMCAQLHFLNLSHNSIHLDLSQAYSWHECTSLHTLDLSYNFYTGSLPSNLTNLPSLQHLQLSSNKLGTIPSSTCSPNSSSLHFLDISANSLDGTFPLSLLQCLSLQYLDLSHNSLAGNIPPQLGKMVSLQVLNIAENNFTGSLPGSLGGLANLEVFMAGSNQINGSVPPQLLECKNLVLIALDGNHLQGPLPDFLGDMVSLEYIAFHDNKFSGTIPVAMLQPSSKLKLLDVSTNSLSGQIPVQFGNLPSLQYLMLANNKFTGGIPSEIGSMTGLQMLDLSSSHLTGRIPSSLGQLQHLLWLNLAFNNLVGPIPPQLGDCRSLLWLNLRSNSLSGLLPPELASMGMDPTKTFQLNAKQLFPPKNLGMCSVLKRWVPEDYPPYSFVYDILQDRDGCKSYWLDLLTKTPFDTACSTPGIHIPRAKGYIQLSNNKLTGPILSSLQANRTTFLLLSFNRFDGSLPDGLSQLPLLAINASHNMLEGPIPESLGDNTCLTLLDLSYNNLSGLIPASLAGNLTQLSALNLSFNPLLSGAIPSTGQFATFNHESYLNDSLLCVEFQRGMMQNGSTSIHFPLCNINSGSNSSWKNGQEAKNYGRQVSKGSATRSEAPLIGGILISLSICLGGALTLWVLWRWPIYARGTALTGHADEVLKRDHSTSTVYFFKEISITDISRSKASVAAPMKVQFTYTDLLLATDNFSAEHIIGCGGFGTVYKAMLRDGSMVAIKKLMIEGRTSAEGEREFVAEMETLGTITHENLVPLIAWCRCGGEKLLVYKLMRNGSLEDWLHGMGEDGEEDEREWRGVKRERGGRGEEDEENVLNGGGGGEAGEAEREIRRDAEKLSWEMRVQIARGCAKALSYLHEECEIIHRDVKASNVLLDDHFNAYVTDFGLARQLPPGVSHVSTIVAGTLGYVAPEYCHTWRATTKGDVYSFGVLLLELLTGQRPITCAALSLVDWVRMLASQSRAAEAWHPVVRRTAAGRFHQVLAFTRLALACTSDRPQQRPSMPHVALTLQEIH